MAYNPGQYRRRDFFAPDSRVVVRRQISQSPTRQHVHDFVEIVVILSGTAIHRAGRFRHRLRPGDVFVIPMARAHGYEAPERLNIANILVREDFFERLESSFSHLEGYHTLFTLGAAGAGFTSRTHLNPGEMEQVAAWIDRMEEETSRRGAEAAALAEAWLTVIVGFLSRLGPGRVPEPRPETRFGRLLSWIEQNASQKIRLAAMTRVAAMSERTLLRRFRQATGGSAMEYVQAVRLRRARQLIERGGESLSDVAEHCGFENANYLSRVFKKRFGKSPRHWRVFAGAGRRAARSSP